MDIKTGSIILGIFFLYLFISNGIKHLLAKRRKRERESLFNNFGIHPSVGDKIEEWSRIALDSDLDIDMLLAFLRYQNIYVAVNMDLRKETTFFMFFVCDLEFPDKKRIMLSDKVRYSSYQKALQASVICGIEVLQERLLKQK